MNITDKKYVIDEIHYFENMEQFDALISVLRYRMISYLTSEPKTSAQLARDLGITRPKAHYHLQILVKHGLVKFVDEILVNGIVEKYYIARARFFSFDRLTQHAATHPADTDFNTGLAQLKNRFLITILEVSRDKLLGRNVDNLSNQDFTFDFGCWLSPCQVQEIQADLERISSKIRAFSEINLGQKDQDALQHFRNIFLFIASPSNSILLKDDLKRLTS